MKVITVEAKKIPLLGTKFGLGPKLQKCVKLRTKNPNFKINILKSYFKKNKGPNKVHLSLKLTTYLADGDVDEAEIGDAGKRSSGMLLDLGYASFMVSETPRLAVEGNEYLLHSACECLSGLCMR